MSAQDTEVDALHETHWGLTDTSLAVSGLADGGYFWRAAAIDAFGLPGRWSQVRRFRATTDDDPPYIVVSAPEEGAIFRTADVLLEGTTEPGVELRLNDRYLATDGSGKFTTVVKAKPGPMDIRLTAIDPAGNRTERVRTFVYRPDREFTLNFDPAIPQVGGVLLTNTDILTVGGTTNADPGSTIKVSGPQGTLLETLVGDDGGFSFGVPASSAETDFSVTVIAVTGAEEAAASLRVRRDEEPPAVIFDPLPPAATANDWVELNGRAEGAAELLLNAAPVRLRDEGFSVVATLEEGPNIIELVAREVVGNVTVRRVTVVVDRDPPVVGRFKATRPRGNGGPIEIQLPAQDASGLRQTAPYRLTVGGRERTGFLRYEAADGTYRDVLPARQGRVRLLSAEIEDYAGNRVTLGD